MKRDSHGNPIIMMHRWNRPPLSCAACREKKRRCDRAQPCSNCVQRNISCQYSGQSCEITGDRRFSQPDVSVETGQSAAQIPAPGVQLQSPREREILSRINKLEEAMFENSKETSHDGISAAANPLLNPPIVSRLFTPFGSHQLPDNRVDSNEDVDLTEAIKKLPPIRQARELFMHFIEALHSTFGLFHIPTTRSLLEQTYLDMLDDKQPTLTTLMLFFGIFAGAALVWSPGLLAKLNTTQTEARIAFQVYSQVALSIVEHPSKSLQPSTNAMIAMCILAHLLTNDGGFSIKVNLLQTRCFLMARAMQIHRLDTAHSREERRLKGCDFIEIEVQRRFWWHMVASDWLLAFSGSAQEGAYIFQPKHMNVNFPSNTDDELLLATVVQQGFPLSVPTAFSGSIQRIKMATLCREVVDALPSILLDSQEAEYEVILALDKKFHEFIKDIPDFFKMDEESVRKNQAICSERPYITWQRLNLHFSFHTRLCRLHRPYHLEGITNLKYAYSTRVCIRSAQTVLELRKAMDEIGPEAGGYPARFWRVVQHVFLAALILATDVSFNPETPDAEARKAKVLAAYKSLEKSKQESGTLFEGVQRNMQTLLSTLQKQRPQVPVAPSETELHGTFVGSDEVAGTNHNDSRMDMQGGTIASGELDEIIMGEENWEQLWSEFVAIAPDLDVPQWNSLLEDVDFGSGWLENV